MQDRWESRLLEAVRISQMSEGGKEKEDISVEYLVETTNRFQMLED